METTTITIAANQNARIRYRVPSSRIIEFDVRADHSVKTYIMSTRGLSEFDEGLKRFRYYGGFQDPTKRHHHQKLILPFDGHWWLMIVNPSGSRSVEVEYEVSF
jgi:hypothetical protein